jgi:hypothetical protein
MLAPPGLQKQVIPSDSFALDAQLSAAMPGSPGVRLGDAATMHQHMEQAVHLEHPLQAASAARQDLLCAIQFVVAKQEAGVLAAERDSRLAAFPPGS